MALSASASASSWLTSLSLQGFKSFTEEEQTLSFDRGMCIICGPNGAGKSNVIDAILFVLGEDVSKLRATKLSDLRSSSSEQLGARTCVVTAKIRSIASDSCGLHTISAELKADRVERRLDGAIISNKALREWLQRCHFVSDGALYCIRQAEVQNAVNSKTLFPLIVSASGCSSYLAAREEAVKNLGKEELRLAKIDEDVAYCQTAIQRSVDEHSLVARRVAGRALVKRVDLLHALASDGQQRAYRRALVAKLDKLDLLDSAARAQLASSELEAKAVRSQMSSLASAGAGGEEGVQLADGLREQFDRLLPAIESEEADLVDASVEMAAVGLRLAGIKMKRFAESDQSECSLGLVTSLREQRTALGAMEESLLSAWSSMRTRLESCSVEDLSAELCGEGDRLRRQHQQLAVQLEADQAKLALARAASSSARGALLDARAAVVELETRLADARHTHARIAPEPLQQSFVSGDELINLEGRQAACSLRVARLRQTLASTHAEVGQLTSVPDFISAAGLHAQACSFASLVAMHGEKVAAAGWIAHTLDALLASSLKVVVVPTTDDAQRAIQRSLELGTAVRIWPSDRIQRTDVQALLKAQAAVIQRCSSSPASSGASTWVVRPLELLRYELEQEQAIAFAVGAKLLVRDGEAARRVLGAATGELAWCVDECIAADGTRHRREIVRGGSDDAPGGAQLVDLLVRCAALEKGLAEAVAELAALELAVQHQRAGHEQTRRSQALESSLSAAKARLSAASECARVRDENCASGESILADALLRDEILCAALQAWPVTSAFSLTPTRASELVAQCAKSVAAKCQACLASLDDKLALAESSDLEAHGHAEVCARLCEKLEWALKGCVERAGAANHALVRLDTTLAPIIAQCEAATADAAEASRRARSLRERILQHEAEQATVKEALAGYGLELARLRTELANGDPLAEHTGPWNELYAESESDCGEVTLLLSRCKTLRAQTATEARSPDEAEADAEAWRALVHDVQSLRSKGVIALRRLEAGSELDETRVLREAAGHAARLEEMADFERKRTTIKDSITVLSDGIAETDTRSRLAIDASLDEIRRSFSALFAELVPSKSATIVTVGDHQSDSGLNRQLSVAVRPGSATADGGEWSEDLRELSGGQRTLLSIALLVSCALHKASDLLILDEVDAALDDKNVELVAKLLCRVANKGQVIAISHRTEFLKLASRKISLTGSRVR